MKLNVKALASAFGVIWGLLGMLLTGLIRLAWPDYGQAFMDVMASLFPGIDSAATLKNALYGALYGLVDGAIVGALFAWAYNYNVARFTRSS